MNSTLPLKPHESHAFFHPHLLGGGCIPRAHIGHDGVTNPPSGQPIFGLGMPFLGLQAPEPPFACEAISPMPTPGHTATAADLDLSNSEVLMVMPFNYPPRPQVSRGRRQQVLQDLLRLQNHFQVEADRIFKDAVDPEACRASPLQPRCDCFCCQLRGLQERTNFEVLRAIGKASARPHFGRPRPAARDPFFAASPTDHFPAPPSSWSDGASHATAATTTTTSAGGSPDTPSDDFPLPQSWWPLLEGGGRRLSSEGGGSEPVGPSPAAAGNPDAAAAARRQQQQQQQQQPTGYRCELGGCGQRFATQRDLRRHQQSKKHGGPKEHIYCCSVEGCGHYFTREDNLKRHRRRKHSG